MTGDSAPGPRPTLLLVEARTTLLRHSHAVNPDMAREILAFTPAASVRTTSRPLARAVSPDTVEGVYCRLPSAAGRRTDGIGTVASRGVLIGGRIALASSRTLIAAGRPGVPARRRGWFTHLANPGVLEQIGRADDDDLARGFTGPSRPGVLDLAAIASRLLDRVQAATMLDGTIPLRTARTRFRFAVHDVGPHGSAPSPSFTIDDAGVRTLVVHAALDAPEQLATLCEEIAAHDWLLTTMQRLVDGLDEPPARAGRIERIAPAVEQLLHLWMPGAHSEPELSWVWSALERRPGFSRQWASIVARIRNELDLSILRALSDGAEPTHQARLRREL
ncbi:SCO2521 family protein [Frankia sp. R82]|uniref:SCO2521 family protein n=1 Tax=Frankia sp. R82 TaxID=2950553 RepID=UPI002044313E|nr:SCO2521 family protein [Frankia sp. R82]MCM3882082.1 SCO2521 family protein [Frankia sp. R82]